MINSIEMEQLKLKFEILAPAGSDCTAPYKVTLNRQCTLQELIDCILADYSGMWGDVGVGGWPFDGRKAEYRYGKIIESNLTEADLNSTIKSIKASCGWSRVNYYVEI